MENYGLMNNGIFQFFPGFGFHPTDEELVERYLKPKIQSLPLPCLIPEADVYRTDPWTLPGGDLEHARYFFSMLQLEHPNGVRTDRTTPSGYWKAYGISKKVCDSQNNQVGTKKSFVFYMSKLPNKTKTNWIMHEYKVVNPTQGMQNWMICRVFLKKSVRNDVMEDEGGPINLDLKLNCGGSSS